MEYLAALAILAFVAFLVFRRKDLLQQKAQVDPKISKVFFVLIFMVPIIIVFLYAMKLKNQGIDPMEQEFNKEQFSTPVEKQPEQNQQPKQQPKDQEQYYDAPATREEGFSL